MMKRPRGVQLLALSHALTAWATLSSSGAMWTKGDVPHVITGHAVRIAGREKDVEQSGRQTALLLGALTVAVRRWLAGCF